MNSKPKSQRSGVGSEQSLRVRKSTRKKQLNRRSVLRMLEAMEQTPAGSPEDPVQEFLTTGRTGRRNAMPDILGVHAQTSTGDLPDCLEKLNTLDTPSSEASTSGTCTQPTTPQEPETPTTPETPQTPTETPTPHPDSPSTAGTSLNS